MKKTIVLAAALITTTVGATNFPFTSVTKSHVGDTNKAIQLENKNVYGYSYKNNIDCNVSEHFTLNISDGSNMHDMYITSAGQIIAGTASLISDSVVIVDFSSVTLRPHESQIHPECFDSSSFLTKSLYNDGITSYYEYKWPEKIILEVYYNLQLDGTNNLSSPTGMSVKTISSNKLTENFYSVSSSPTASGDNNNPLILK